MTHSYDYAVIHYAWGINGGTYDAIEYAYVLSLVGKTKLVIYRKNPKVITTSTITDIISKKYILDINNLPFEIEYKIDNIIDRNAYKSILFIDSICIERLPLYSAKKYFIFADYIPAALSIYNKISVLKNVYTVNEMPFFPSEVNYKFKMAFDIFKKYDYLEDNTLNSYKYVTKHKISHYTKFTDNKTNKIIDFTWPIADFNQKFNRYNYYSQNYFDPRPRIFHECAFYGIAISDIIRYVDNELHDGGYYKYYSLIHGGLECRNLTVNVELIQMMANA